MRASYGTSSVPYFILRGGDDGNIIPLTRPWRKGRRYGTMLVDLERHQPVELLAEYSVSAIADWLRRHRSVRIIVRDRSPVGIQASQQGAPRAAGGRSLPLAAEPD